MRLENVIGIITLKDNYRLKNSQHFKLSKSGKRLFIIENEKILKTFNVKSILGTF